MKNIKMIITVFLISTLALVSCKKDSTTGPGGSDALVGTWQVVNAVVGYIFTTNSNQVATNIIDVTGQVSVTGAVTGTLDFFIVDEDTNPPSFILGDSVNGAIIIFLDGTTGEGMLISNTNGKTFIGDVTFVYNDGTLTITQSTIKDAASADTITISGSMSFNTTNIPANTPTFVPFITEDEGEDAVGFSTIEFRNDGTVTETYVDGDGPETDNYTYITDGNQLTLTDEYNYAMVWEYSVSGNNMTWNSTELITVCDVDETEAECYAELEQWFDLGEGSLTNVIGKAELTFSKTVAKQSVNWGSKINLINPTKMFKDYKIKLENLKLVK